MEKNLKHSIYGLKDLQRVGWRRWLIGWKPIPLCWLFKKYNLPVPRYLIGGANAAPQYEGSRISNSVRAWEAVEDADVTDWTVGDAFCISVGFGTQPGNQSSARILQLRWRNATDGGSFAALSATGELNWGSGDFTNLQNA